MGRFALQQDHGEEEYSDVDSYDEGSPQRWSSDSHDRRSDFWRSECPSNSVSKLSSTFHRALTRYHRGPLEEGEIIEDIDVIPQEDEDTLARYYEPQPPLQQNYHYLHHGNSAAPIHYHIYYTPPPQQQEQQQQQQQQSLSQSSTPWKWIALAAIISHIMYVSGPATRSLQESGSSPFTELLTAWWLAVCHVAWKCTGSYNVDWRLWTRDLDHQVAPVRDFPPTTIADCIATVDVDKWPLFGQPIVLDLMKQALNNPSSRYNMQGPLIFVAVGSPGVGKRYMAQLLAQSCSSTTLLEVDLSTLQGKDHLTTLLRKHLVPMDNDSNVKTAPTILLLSHLSMDDPNQANSIFQSLSTLFNTDELPDGWRNVIVVLTSHSGATTIDKAIRHYGKDSLPSAELVLYLRQSWGLSFHSASAILLPFVPLDRSTVQTMVQTLLPMTIGLDDLNYLIDHTLEWETWIDRPTQMELYTFLPKGGHDVWLLIQQLIPPDYCGNDGQHWDKDSTWLQIQNGNQLQLVSCVNGDSPCDPICRYSLV